MPIFENKEDDLPQEDVEETVAPATPKYTRKETVDVRLLSEDTYEAGCWLVYEVDDKSKVYFVQKDELQHTWKPQPVSKSVLQKASRPYDFAEEIAKFTLTPDQIRLGLYKSGVVNKREDMNFKAFLASLLKSGILPIKEE